MTDPVTLARHKNTLNALMFAQNSVLITWKSKGAFSKCQILTVVFAADPDRNVLVRFIVFAMKC